MAAVQRKIIFDDIAGCMLCELLAISNCAFLLKVDVAVSDSKTMCK
jgi:hypothetical protein